MIIEMSMLDATAVPAYNRVNEVQCRVHCSANNSNLPHKITLSSVSDMLNPVEVDPPPRASTKAYIKAIIGVGHAQGIRQVHKVAVVDDKPRLDSRALALSTYFGS